MSLALRVAHLSSALQSPLCYRPGADEDYYLRFGQAVATGVGQDSSEFTFMDPGYGYLLGLILGSQFPAPALRWDYVVWGYIKMGKFRDARVLAERITSEQPDNGSMMEALAYLAATVSRDVEAVRQLRLALDLRPNSYLAHYNLAKALLALGEKSQAASAVKVTMELHPSADTQALLSTIEAAP